MTALRPFFLLLARPSIFWVGLFTVTWLSILVAGFSNPDAREHLYVDSILLAALGFPVAAGWLVGLAVQEFEHTSFARFLPGVRSRLMAGSLTAGLIATGLTVGLVSTMTTTPQNLPLLFVLGLGAYCAGGVLLDPLSNWVTAVNTIVLLFLVARSADVARLVNDHPWPAAGVAVVAGALGLHRLYGRSTLRLKPFRPTSPLPGRFSFERSQQMERDKRVRDRSEGSHWNVRYLGVRPWAWVRAALHESRGAGGLKGVARTISRLWGLGLLILIHAWIDKGELAFGEALARSMYDTLFRSPHVAPFGEKGGLYAMVMIVIAGAGIVTVLLRPVTLGIAMAYPLSRAQRARITFRAGLLDAGIFLFLIGPGLFVAGHAMGWLVGHEVRFDFMPYYFRCVLVTVILLPLGHWGRFMLQEATRRKAENTTVGIAVGVVGFVVVVAFCASISTLVFTSPLLELAVLTPALLLSQWIYRGKLYEYYRTADLA